MKNTFPALLVILMITAAAGCISEDTSDLDSQIEDLDSQNTNLTQTVADRDSSISQLEAIVSEHEANIAGLEAAIALMEDQRDSLLALLSDSQEFANQTIALAEAMNETIAGLHAMLGENATLVLLLQSDLAAQQDLVAYWQQTAEDNRADLIDAYLGYSSLRFADLSGADLSGAGLRYTDMVYANLSGADLTGADLSDAYLNGADLTGADLTGADLGDADLSGADLGGADITGVNWDGATCPDGIDAYYNGQTCENNL